MNSNKNQDKKIIAVVGMCGSGKTEVVKYLQEKYNWPNIYLPEALFDEIKKKGMKLNWKNEEKIRNGLRKQYGMSVFAKLSLPKIEKALIENETVLIESLYSWSEHKLMKKEFPKSYRVIAVYAPPKLRYNRLKNRKVRPMKTYKEFEGRDRSEIEKIEKGGPIAVADYTLINNGNLKELHRQIDKALLEFI